MEQRHWRTDMNYSWPEIYLWLKIGDLHDQGLIFLSKIGKITGDECFILKKVEIKNTIGTSA